MGEHLALLVDRLLTESTLEATLESRRQGQIATKSAYVEDQGKQFARKINVRDRAIVGKLVECRICQEEDEECTMEVPCSCCGSLKYAHRKCIQRWCNEKGDKICEICLQQFEPGYTAPPKLFQLGTIPTNFRGNWEITRQDLHDSQIITLVPSDRDLSHHRDDDDYSALGVSSAVFCQSLALIFMIILVLRQILPLILSGAGQFSFTLFSLLVLRTAGLLLPVFVIIRTIKTFNRCRRHQEPRDTSETAEGENFVTSWHLVQPHSHRIQVV